MANLHCFCFKAQPVCKKIDVKSNVNRGGRVDVKDSSGNPVDIVYVNVWDQISRIKCKERVNYFYSGSSITARDGCHATFKVCYNVIEPTTPASLTLTVPPNPGRTWQKFKLDCQYHRHEDYSFLILSTSYSRSLPSLSSSSSSSPSSSSSYHHHYPHPNHSDHHHDHNYHHHHHLYPHHIHHFHHHYNLFRTKF